MSNRILALTLTAVLAFACGDKDDGDTSASTDSGSSDGGGTGDTDDDGVSDDSVVDDSVVDDRDRDGVNDEDDCEPDNPEIYPGAKEVCNGVDDDCDRLIDDADPSVDMGEAGIYYEDQDLDGYAGGSVAVSACSAPVNHYATSLDCDDADPATHPLAPEVPYDGLDQDCDGSDLCDVDEDGIVATECGGGDCNDSDASTGVIADDPDCDGVLTHAGGGDLVRIAASSFDVGCTAGQSSCGADEQPVMPVTLTNDYYLGETEVTVREYQLVMGSNPGRATCGQFNQYASNCPVDQVSWHMAAAYTNALSHAAGLTQCYACFGTGSSTTCTVAMSVYACDGYRLPTEAEWEGAARCGDDQLYSGSDTATDVAWFSSNAASNTHEVGLLAANACGLYDMSGNVWEWVHDWYDSAWYTSAGRTDPEGPTTGTARAPRGGGYWNTPEWVRVASRGVEFVPTYREAYTGFRVARTAD